MASNGLQANNSYGDLAKSAQSSTVPPQTAQQQKIQVQQQMNVSQLTPVIQQNQNAPQVENYTENFFYFI